uniref:Myb/SANT-like domain-containing protein n=1 Tax=Tanacetum cinerariifolium TaxID=118510 RepID=A0A6L2JLC2_TANCI|nr:hypothetical protein [Tanacetum cinerariifolium]
MDALLQLHSSEKYVVDNGFKPGYNQVVETLLDVILLNSDLKAKPHIRSRLKTLSIDFSTFHDMVVGSSISRFGWDPEKCILTTHEDVWDGYLKTHPKASVFKDKHFLLYHKLSAIFGKDRSNRSRAIDLGDEDVVGETQETTTNDLENQDIDMVAGPSPRGVDGKSKKRKRGKTDELLHIIVQSEIDLMRRVQNEIDVLPGITFEEANEAIDVIGSCPLKAERLFEYDNMEKSPNG